MRAEGKGGKLDVVSPELPPLVFIIVLV